MQCVIAGCEYVGTTTLAKSICGWLEQITGAKAGLHDHFKWPFLDHKPLADDEIAQLMALSPRLREEHMRYMVEYHLSPNFFSSPHHIMVGMHLDEAVYAPLYYGYGGSGEYADRTVEARRVEAHIMEMAPHTMQVLVTATPDVIATRMRADPHPYGLLKESDIENVLERFAEEHTRSLLRNKMVIDTSDASPSQSLAEFVRSVLPFLTDTDRSRILVNSLGKDMYPR